MKNFTFLSLILLFLIKTQNIYAKESTFTVDNILVSSELTNINNSSREKYLNIGFKVEGVFKKHVLFENNYETSLRMALFNNKLK